MPSARDTAKALFERNRSQLPKHVPADVERAWEDRAKQEHGAASKWSRSNANDSIGIAIPPMGGLGIILLVLFWLIAVAVVWIHRYLGQNPAGATTVIALVLAWVSPPAGICALIGLCIRYMGDGLVGMGPLGFVLLVLPLYAVLLPVRLLAWNAIAVALWRHSYVAVLVFCSLARGQLQFLIPNEPTRIQQAPEAFFWSLLAAAIAVGLSLMAARVVNALSIPFVPSVHRWAWRSGAVRGAYAGAAILIYASGVVALLIYAVRQMLYEFSFISEYT